MYNTAADLEQLATLAETIGNYRSQLEQEITNIYEAINNMQQYWQGASYATFSNECYSYAASLEALVTLLEAFKLLFEGEVAANAQKFIQDCEVAFDNL